MTQQAVAQAAPRVVFERSRVTRRDQAVFVTKLAVAVLWGALGAGLVLSGSLPGLIAGVLLLGALYTHMVELQHQCLHHSAFQRSGPHRAVGVVLGLPLLVSYSHYRVKHLQHHRYLGTDRDSEFFGFDPRVPLTAGALLRGLFDYRRLVAVAVDCWRSWRGTWRYPEGQVSARMAADSVAEYRLFSLVAAGAVAAGAAGFAEQVLALWIAPLLLVALPLHFAVELPEHLRCDADTTDVLRNTRSITGSRFSTWFTNGNNLHVEHHAAMTVPLQRLPERHTAVRECAKYVERTYWAFYRSVLHEVMRRPDTR